MITTTPRLTAADWDSWYTARWPALYTAGWPALITDKESEYFHRTVRPRPGMTAADLGCGNGQWTRQLAAWGTLVTGYDFSTEGLRQAAAAGLQDGLSYTRWDIDAEAIPAALLPGTLDLVTCRHALPFLDYARALTDVGRWLKPSGTFYALVRVTADQDNEGAATQNDSAQEPFHRGFTEAQIDELGIGWAHRTAYRLSAHNCGIVLRGYGDTALTPRHAAGETSRLLTPAATSPALVERRAR
ncbi:methyltransferase domain-containing protein [Streptomyces sp. NBC_00989]|uniref:class I SAM-dependent methyltransferase n=1 Tax=Streptomyces sp. NBC_00989 TaxID=2903705 RepID=UPI002F910D32|nr:methyltransferase domain-containing protein [Streptomyces sp. NBC_00989]